MSATVTSIVAAVEAAVTAAGMTKVPDHVRLERMPQTQHYQVVVGARERAPEFGSIGLSRWLLPMQVRVAYLAGYERQTADVLAQTDQKTIADYLLDDDRQPTGATLFVDGGGETILQEEVTAADAEPAWFVIGLDIHAEWTEAR